MTGFDETLNRRWLLGEMGKIGVTNTGVGKGGVFL